MRWITEELYRHSPLSEGLSRLAVVLALFACAWVVARLGGRAGGWLVDRSQRRDPGDDDTGVVQGLRQRETAITLLQTTFAYAAFALALVLSLATLSGAHRVETVVGASFLALVVGFAAQRFLTDVIAGLLMFFEGWFRVGDTIDVAPWDVKGVVERVTLRTLTVRGVDGTVMHVPNSEVKATKVLPRGFREVEAELFARDREEGCRLVDRVAAIVPYGPTRFVRRPRVVDDERLDGELHRITARAAVAPGREWLALDLLPSLLKERARDGVLVHGPVVTLVDDAASRRFARAVWTGRRAQARPLEALRRAERDARPSDSW